MDNTLKNGISSIQDNIDNGADLDFKDAFFEVSDNPRKRVVYLFISFFFSFMFGLPIIYSFINSIVIQFDIKGVWITNIVFGLIGILIGFLFIEWYKDSKLPHLTLSFKGIRIKPKRFFSEPFKVVFDSLSKRLHNEVSDTLESKYYQIRWDEISAYWFSLQEIPLKRNIKIVYWVSLQIKTSKVIETLELQMGLSGIGFEAIQSAFAKAVESKGIAYLGTKKIDDNNLELNENNDLIKTTSVDEDAHGIKGCDFCGMKREGHEQSNSNNKTQPNNNIAGQNYKSGFRCSSCKVWYWLIAILSISIAANLPFWILSLYRTPDTNLVLCLTLFVIPTIIIKIVIENLFYYLSKQLNKRKLALENIIDKNDFSLLLKEIKIELISTFNGTNKLNNRLAFVLGVLILVHINFQNALEERYKEESFHKNAKIGIRYVENINIGTTFNKGRTTHHIKISADLRNKENEINSIKKFEITISPEFFSNGEDKERSDYISLSKYNLVDTALSNFTRRLKHIPVVYDSTNISYSEMLLIKEDLNSLGVDKVGLKEKFGLDSNSYHVYDTLSHFLRIYYKQGGCALIDTLKSYNLLINK